jgi:hypothetical protein
MKNLQRVSIPALAVATCSTLVAIAAPAQAGTLYGGWNYAIDSFTDSSSASGRGGTEFEIYGMAYKQVGDNMYFAVNANAGRDGNESSNAKDGHIGFGDLMLSFANGKTFGVNFATLNDSGVNDGKRTTTNVDRSQALGNGLYSDITTKDMTAVSSGYSSMASFVGSGSKAYGHSFGDVDPTTLAYYNQSRSAPTNIATGTKQGDVLFHGDGSGLDLNFGAGLAADAAANSLTNLNDPNATQAALGRNGVNTAKLGSETFVFSFQRTADMVGDFTASLLFECINDGIALKGTVALASAKSEATVPEPGSAIAIAFVGLSMAGLRRRRAQSAG